MDPNMNQYTQNNCCSHKSFGMLVEKPAAPTHTTLRRPNLSIDASQNPPIHSSNRDLNFSNFQTWRSTDESAERFLLMSQLLC